MRTRVNIAFQRPRIRPLPMRAAAIEFALSGLRTVHDKKIAHLKT